jgi:hypothetical protein
MYNTQFRVQSISAFVALSESTNSEVADLFLRHQNLVGKPSTMGKKKGFRPKKAMSPSQMYPRLHCDVVNAVFEYIGATRFHENDSDSGSINRYSTCVMGVFICSNYACPKVSWGSGKVAIMIRKYPNNGYNAIVYNQRCESCEELGRLKLDERSYVDRVSYRLKKWAGVDLKLPNFTLKETPPHKTHLCEGCKRGAWAEMIRWQYR